MRNFMFEKRDQIDNKKILNLSEKVISRLTSSKEYIESKNIFVFVSTEKEVFTHNFIKNSINLEKNIYIPHIDNENKTMGAALLRDFSDLEIGFYDILSLPKSKVNIVEPDKIDLIVVPGLIFGKNFYRIGYGGGYYDKYLIQDDLKSVNIGVCFEFQIVDEVKFEKFDVPVDKIITELNDYERRKLNE